MVNTRHWIWTGLVIVGLAWLGGYPSLAEGSSMSALGEQTINWVRLLGVFTGVPLAVTTVALAWRWAPTGRRRTR
jgi:hypothetical protein